ncbi:hypothetical protein IF1G_04761 [Cordyceps javanica]|uniref:Uncharacterized protein n=1 Tax=Cordyceps javanica TaxID=43265 RepID=A0A545V391_9HYPO|nr:hypothetical protein IF1G_04761 [Cordyceps javanica]
MGASGMRKEKGLKTVKFEKARQKENKERVNFSVAEQRVWRCCGGFNTRQQVVKKGRATRDGTGMGISNVFIFTPSSALTGPPDSKCRIKAQPHTSTSGESHRKMLNGQAQTNRGGGVEVPFPSPVSAAGVVWNDKAATDPKFCQAGVLWFCLVCSGVSPWGAGAALETCPGLRQPRIVGIRVAAFTFRSSRYYPVIIVLFFEAEILQSNCLGHGGGLPFCCHTSKYEANWANKSVTMLDANSTDQ